jgi:hypothetical protein
MKQGRADSSGPRDQKVEPTSRGVNPGAVSYLGAKLGNHVMDDGVVGNSGGATPWDAGRGYRAPGIGSKSHKNGSQGSY